MAAMTSSACPGVNRRQASKKRPSGFLKRPCGVRGPGGCCVRWLIVGLLVLIVLVGLVVFIRRRHSRPAADDTLVTDLLGPADLPTIPASRARWAGTRSPARQARE